MSARKLLAMILIFRPELPFSAGVCVVLGSILALGHFPPWRESALGFFSVFFISGSALALNDVFDLEVDRVNTPERPLPAGMLSSGEAIGLSAIAILLGLGASIALGFPAFLLCCISCAIGILYNWRYKEEGLTGNLMVAASVAMTFVYGGIVVGQPWNGVVWTFGLMAFLIDLGEEIAGDAMDVEGDKKRNSKSIPIIMGRTFALRLSGMLFSLVVAISFVPLVFAWLDAVYLIMIVIMDVSIAFFAVRLVKSKTPEEGKQSMRGLYLSALLGMLAFLVGQVL